MRSGQGTNIILHSSVPVTIQLGTISHNVCKSRKSDGKREAHEPTEKNCYVIYRGIY